VAKKLGVKMSDATPVKQGLILFFEEPALYLNWTRVAELGLDAERVKRAVRDSLKEIAGVQTAFTNSQLMTTTAQPTGVERALRLSFRADRSGDVLVALKAGYIWNYTGTGTTHGQPVEDDQHVPLLLFGRGVKKGTYDDAVAPTFLAKSIGATMSVDAGGADTEVLACFR
jgi:hypothetical protein